MRLYPQFLWLVAGLSMVLAATAMTAPLFPVTAMQNCSTDASVVTSVTFTNLRSRSVAVLWVNPECGEVFYRTLRPGASYTQPTFVSQRWRVRDAETSALLDEVSAPSFGPTHTVVGAYEIYLPLVNQTNAREALNRPSMEQPVAQQIEQPAVQQIEQPAVQQIEQPITPPVAPPNDALPPGRSTVDRPDDVGGYQVHVMYVVPSDGVDRELDLNGSLVNSVHSFQNWLAQQSGGSRLRIDTYGGNIDVTFHRLSQTDATIASHGAFVRDQVESGIRAAGFNAPNKLYAVYYDGASNTACGGAAWPPVLMGNAAVVYLQGLPNEPMPCNSARFASSPTAPPEYLEFSMLHEIFHTLGAAPTCAARHVLQGHVSDSNTDLMYSGPLPWYPSVLDYGRDDYWGHNNPNCLDLSKSVFLDPLPADPVKPPGWP